MHHTAAGAVMSGQAPSPWSARPVEILVVEDEPADRYLLEHAVRHHRLPIRLHAVIDGTQALALLSTSMRPDLILLDLAMPGMSGFETLAALKEDPSLCSIPVIVLSNSDDPRDVEESYRRHAAAFLSKPRDLEGYATLIQIFSDFWLRVALLQP